MSYTAPVPEDILVKIRHFCAYRERSHQEVRTKLLQLRVYGEDLETVMSMLIQEDFLNDERFARTYARSKFNLKKWGRKKIWQELKGKGVTDYCLNRAMEEIDQEEYLSTLREEILKKARSMREEDKLVRLRKVCAALINKGYEQELVFRIGKEELG